MEQAIAEELRRLHQTRFAELEFDCGRTQDAGVHDVDQWRDWSDFETTPDQRRIEDYLARFDLSGKRLLHIGIGNSGLARRFHRRVRTVVGTTVVTEELAKASALGFRNYEFLLHNKYLGQGLQTEAPFDFIIDNNPSTFCCCMKHFGAMLSWYSASLATGGQILTDRVGLGWVIDSPSVDDRWKFTFDDLALVANCFGLQAYRMDENTYVLARSQPERPGRGSMSADFRDRIAEATTKFGSKLKALSGKSASQRQKSSS